MTENVVRHTADRGAAHAKDAYWRTQEAAEETTKVMEQTYSAASRVRQILISISLTSLRRT